MAKSPAHKFGQQIGNMLEEILEPKLQEFCDSRGLYLDKKGKRGKARAGSKVSWEDKYGNKHDLDFVIEKGGSEHVRGRPVAFIEAAWRRYTKHSRNKAQEIQGAVLPVVESHPWDRPFIGAALAGIFTNGALDQLRSVGFTVLMFPYETICTAFKEIGLDVRFDENTEDADFANVVGVIDGLDPFQRRAVENRLIELNQTALDEFIQCLGDALDKQIEKIRVIPLFGKDNEFDQIRDATSFINAFDDVTSSGVFQKFEIQVRFTNGDNIEAEFNSKHGALEFLNYVSTR